MRIVILGILGKMGKKLYLKYKDEFDVIGKIGRASCRERV